MNSGYDVIIIGTGAGGGTLANRLAPSGKRILLLERGGWLPREPQNWDAAEVCVRNRYVSPDTWVGPDGGRFQPQSHYYVGGATKVYGAALYRLREEDFGDLRHHDGVSPAWPLTYDEMEPYYTQAERLYRVHGARGEDPTEPWASAPYPFPPVSHEPRIQQLADDLAAMDYHPLHAPCAVMLHEAEMAFSACVRCPTCDGFPCLVHAKSDADVVAVRPALAYPNVTLLTHAKAVRLETNPTGTAVTEVIVEHRGELERYAGDLVVVSCGAANSAKLLLQSANDKHPSGLANGSDEVGRNFMVQIGQAVLALSREPNPTVFQRTLALNDFYLGGTGTGLASTGLAGTGFGGTGFGGTGFAGTGFAHPMGSIQLSGRSQAAMYRGDTALEAALARTWALKDVANHAVDFWLSTEDLPRSHNRVSVDRTGAVRLRYTPTNLASGRRLYAHLKSMLDGLGMHPEHLIHRYAYLKSGTPLAHVEHQAGTCRFGTDPTTSVLDLNCRAHELDNLYVVDTSFFPSIGAVNPALTAMANALRVGDHLLARIGARAPDAFEDVQANGSPTASSSAASCGVGAVPPRWAGSHQRSSGPEGWSG